MVYYCVPTCLRGVFKEEKEAYVMRTEFRQKRRVMADKIRKVMEQIERDFSRTVMRHSSFPGQFFLAALLAKWDLSSLTTEDQTDRCPLQWERKVPTT